jgi:hypothetical protein
MGVAFEIQTSPAGFGEVSAMEVTSVPRQISNSQLVHDILIPLCTIGFEVFRVDNYGRHMKY